MELGKISCDSVNRIEIPLVLDRRSNSTKNVLNVLNNIMGFFYKWEIQNARGYKRGNVYNTWI